MEEACNKNISDEFNPSSINVIDKSMMEWFNIYASVFMCVGFKSCCFGN